MAAEPFEKATVMTACTIRPYLQWIKSPDSQANATLFLAKFYGRTGLLNLINAGPQNFRPGNQLIKHPIVNSYLTVLCYDFGQLC